MDVKVLLNRKLRIKRPYLVSSGWEHYWLQRCFISLCSSSHKLPSKLPSLLECCALSPAPSVWAHTWNLMLPPTSPLTATSPHAALSRGCLHCSHLSLAHHSDFPLFFAAAYIPLYAANSAHLFCLVPFYPFQQYGLCTPYSQLRTTKDPVFLLLQYRWNLGCQVLCLPCVPPPPHPPALMWDLINLTNSVQADLSHLKQSYRTKTLLHSDDMHSSDWLVFIIVGSMEKNNERGYQNLMAWFIKKLRVGQYVRQVESISWSKNNNIKSSHLV